MCTGNDTFGNDLSTRPPYFVSQKFATSEYFSCKESSFGSARDLKNRRSLLAQASFQF